LKISITHDVHPAEYTKDVAEAMGYLFGERGYDTSVHKVPFEETCWGVAMRGGSLYDVVEAGDLVYRPDPETDYFFDLHASADVVLNPKGLSADKLRFGDYNDRKWYKTGGVAFIRYDPRIVIEIPQVWRAVSMGFLRAILQRCPGVEGTKNFELRFRSVADRPATAAKYPPIVLARIIVDGIEEQIIES